MILSDYYPIPPQPPHLPTPTPSPHPLPSPPPFTPSLHPLLPQVESTPYSNVGVRPIDNSRSDMTLASLPEGFYSGSALHKDGSLLSVWFQVRMYVHWISCTKQPFLQFFITCSLLYNGRTNFCCYFEIHYKTYICKSAYKTINVYIIRINCMLMLTYYSTMPQCMHLI